MFCPFGRIFDWRAAFSADARSIGWPLTARAETTFPRSSTAIRTLTSPEARICFAAAGYAGTGRRTARLFNTPEFGLLDGGVGEARGGVWPGLIIIGDGVGNGVREGVGVVSSSSGVDVGEAVGVALGLGLGVGVGVGVLKLALVFMLGFAEVLEPLFVLKAKLPSMPRLVLTFVFIVRKFALVLIFELLGLSFCSIQKIAAPAPSKTIVPNIVKNTTFAVFERGSW